MSCNKKIGAMLRTARKESNMTQQEVADELGYTHPMFVSLMERGESKVPFETIGRLCRMYDIHHNVFTSLIINDFEDSLYSAIKVGMKKGKRL